MIYRYIYTHPLSLFEQSTETIPKPRSHGYTYAERLKPVLFPTLCVTVRWREFTCKLCLCFLFFRRRVGGSCACVLFRVVDQDEERGWEGRDLSTWVLRAGFPGLRKCGVFLFLLDILYHMGKDLFFWGSSVKTGGSARSSDRRCPLLCVMNHDWDGPEQTRVQFFW